MDTKEEIYSIILNTDKTLVFTSETMARNTLSDFISAHPGRAVFKDRFISWDRFLLSLCDIKNKREVTDTERIAFVSLFIKKHGLDYLSYFVDNKYVESIPSFTRYISHILPYLPNKDSMPLFIDKSMKEDIEKIRPEYEKYLEERNLYEERYLERDLNRIEKDKIVFVYPESFTSTFASTVVDSGKVDVINIPTPSYHIPLHEYNNSISEIRGIMRMVERDLSTYAPEDIAITSSSLETYRPYLEEEAKKRDIPLLFTSNLPLTSYPEGKLLKLFYSLDKNRWGVDEYKKLVSDPSFPFKDRDLLLTALHIGVDMKLVGGGYKYWMRAFDIADKEYSSKYKNIKEAKSLFDSLYKAISLIVKSKKSLDTENRIRDFRNRFLIEGEWDEKNNRILGTALEILEGLKELEDVELYRIFLSILKDTTYVTNNGDENGVKVYAYPASAGLSIKRHYIIGLDDKSTSLKLDDYPFASSTNKPEPLDIGKSILSLYSNPDFSDFTYISGTSEGYDGSRLLPTLFLDNLVREEIIERDSYTDEMKNGDIKCTKSQSDSYKIAKETVLKEKSDREKVNSLSSSPLTLSVSDVKSWDTCPYKGYIQSILKISKLNYESDIEDNFLKGDILHETIEKSLEEKGSLKKIDVETLQKNLSHAIDESRKIGRIPDDAVESHIYSSIWRKLAGFKESKGIEYYEDKELVANEKSFSGHVLGEKVNLKGRIDTILKDNEGKLYIIDYKLKGDDDWSKDNLDDMSLQVILYYMLVTSDTADKEISIDSDTIVESGGFYSLGNKKFRIVWPTVGTQGFTLDAVIINANDRINEILDHIKNGDITPDPSEDNCKNCDYKRLCRGRFVAK